MQNNKKTDIIYLCGYTGGDYDDYYRATVFATKSKSKATKWKQKFNRILKKWKKYYSQYEGNNYNFPWIKDEYLEQYYDRWNSLRGINNAFVEEIELR